MKMLDKEIKDLMQKISCLQKKNIIKNRINKIILKHIRGFKDDSIVEFQFPISVIVGKNGSGKSTVLRLIQVLAKNYEPQNEFFEIEFDNGNLKKTKIEYEIDGKIEKLSYSEKNKWYFEKEIEHIDITAIRPKTLVGAIDKSFLYDNIGKYINRTKQVEYLIKQSKKIQQNPEISGRKKRKILDSKELYKINEVLQSNYSSIEFIEHKFFSGTWATTILFKKEDENEFCEYNAGSGEFLITNIIDRIFHTKKESIVLIDEPEISLHPGAQKRLLKVILEFILEKKIQVIISTHSQDIVKNFSPQGIICIEKQNNSISQVKNSIFPEQAFFEIEVTPDDKKQIIVEDDLACSIIQSVLEKEKLDKLLQVIYIPGGASNLKKYIIPAFSKVNINNHFIWLDGDQYKKDVPDFTKELEKNKTEEYYKRIFKNCVGIETKNIDWCPDGNSKVGRKNEDQEIKMIIQYLEYFKENVFFFSEKIPEDIIYDEEYIKAITRMSVVPNSVSQAKNSKEKIKRWSEESEIPLESIEKILVSDFKKNRNKHYQNILETLKKIIRK